MEATILVFYRDYIGVIYRFIWGQVGVGWDGHVGVTTQSEMANFFAELEYMSIYGANGWRYVQHLFKRPSKTLRVRW